MSKKDYFPLFVDLNEKEIIVFGGGKIATRRIKTLLSFGAIIKVIAKTVSKELIELANRNKINILIKNYEASDIKNCLFVLAATDDEEVNNNIYHSCKEKEIVVNCAHDKTKCDFFFPSVIKEGEYVIGITSSGTNHSGVKELANSIRNGLRGEK